MFMIVALGNLVVQIPMAALTGVMIMVAISSFDWSSLRTLHRLPRTDAIVLVVTIAVVLTTHNLAYGVLSGVLLSMIFFASKISKIHVSTSVDHEKNTRLYYVEGPLFFASVTPFLNQFDTEEKVNEVVIDLTHSQIWDDSAVGALDRLEAMFTANEIHVSYQGLNEKSSTLLKALGQLKE